LNLNTAQYKTAMIIMLHLSTVPFLLFFDKQPTRTLLLNKGIQ
jgi:hypothetical protein